MTSDEIIEYNKSYIENYMEFYGDGMTPGDEEIEEEVISLVDQLSSPTPNSESASSKRSWMRYDVEKENPNTCRNCPRRRGRVSCPLPSYTQQSSCTEGGYHRHPMNAELRIKEAMP